MGKTDTAARRARSSFRLDQANVQQALQAQPELITTARPPVLIDECQLLPEVWDTVRRAVDADRSVARFLLTGGVFSKDWGVNSFGGWAYCNVADAPHDLAGKRNLPPLDQHSRPFPRWSGVARIY